LTHEELRQSWIDEGPEWWGNILPEPEGWSAAEQLKYFDR